MADNETYFGHQEHFNQQHIEDSFGYDSTDSNYESVSQLKTLEDKYESFKPFNSPPVVPRSTAVRKEVTDKVWSIKQSSLKTQREGF